MPSAGRSHTGWASLFVGSSMGWLFWDISRALTIALCALHGYSQQCQQWAVCTLDPMLSSREASHILSLELQYQALNDDFQTQPHAICLSQCSLPVRDSATMTTHIKEDISSGLAYVQRLSPLLTWGAWQHVQTWCWRNWELYIWIRRQQTLGMARNPRNFQLVLISSFLL